MPEGYGDDGASVLPQDRDQRAAAAGGVRLRPEDWNSDDSTQAGAGQPCVSVLPGTAWENGEMAGGKGADIRRGGGMRPYVCVQAGKAAVYENGD